MLLQATLTNTGNLRIRAADLMLPMGTLQPVCTIFDAVQTPAGWAPGADIAVGSYVQCNLTLTDLDPQHSSLTSGGALQMDLMAAVQASAGQAMAPVSSTTQTVVQFLAEPSLSTSTDPSTCTVGELIWSLCRHAARLVLAQHNSVCVYSLRSMCTCA